VDGVELGGVERPTTDGEGIRSRFDLSQKLHQSIPLPAARAPEKVEQTFPVVLETIEQLDRRRRHARSPVQSPMRALAYDITIIRLVALSTALRPHLQILVFITTIRFAAAVGFATAVLAAIATFLHADLHCIPKQTTR
jgi:hypothetical protein